MNYHVVVLASGEEHIKISYTSDIDTVVTRMNRNINEAGVPIPDFILVRESGALSLKKASNIKTQLLNLTRLFISRSYPSGTFTGCTNVFKYDKDLIRVLGEILNLTKRIKYEVRK